MKRWQAVVAYVIIPGIDGSDEQHWQTLWEHQWGTSAVRISPASWSAPDLDDWVNAVQTAYDDACRQDSRVVLVAHSLGCWAASTWLNKNPASPIHGAFLVAPPDPQGLAVPTTGGPDVHRAVRPPVAVPGPGGGQHQRPVLHPRGSRGLRGAMGGAMASGGRMRTRQLHAAAWARGRMAVNSWTH